MAEQEPIYSADLHLNHEVDKGAQDDRFAAERQAFWSLHSQLLEKYEGKYVAILNGKVVDSDADKRALAQRLYREFGYQPVYVQLVMAASLPIYRMSSSRRIVPR
jgi:uncharacterized protein DUF5678